MQWPHAAGVAHACGARVALRLVGGGSHNNVGVSLRERRDYKDESEARHPETQLRLNNFGAWKRSVEHNYYDFLGKNRMITLLDKQGKEIIGS